MTAPIRLAKTGDLELSILPRMANRHGLIAGATGTGKTVTLQAMAEQFSRSGVPVFMADVKGDLSGLGQAGGQNPKVNARLAELGLDAQDFAACPVTFWDVFARKGHPIRTTVAEMGPLLLSRMLNLNEVQSGVLNAAFRIADAKGWLLLDLKDLRAMVQHLAEAASEYSAEFGNISAASVGAIQRALLQMETEGAVQIFGEPALNLDDMMQTDSLGRGLVNILAADALYNSPRVYATLLLWLLSELFEKLPEVGDLDQPKLVFFFDEAHLLFNDSPPALLEKIEQVVRLIRSKGVGIYFVSQNPLDIPDVVLGQLGNRIQHALRAFTPRDQKAVKSAAETFRANPGLDVTQAITELGVGEALVSFLDEKGRPNPVERAFVIPPGSYVGALSDATRQTLIQQSVLFGHYERAIDRESAYEILKGRATQGASEAEADRGFDWGGLLGSGSPQSKKGSGRQADSLVQTVVKTAARTIGSELGRQIIRGVLGSILGGRR